MKTGFQILPEKVVLGKLDPREKISPSKSPDQDIFHQGEDTLFEPDEHKGRRMSRIQNPQNYVENPNIILRIKLIIEAKLLQLP